MSTASSDLTPRPHESAKRARFNFRYSKTHFPLFFLGFGGGSRAATIACQGSVNIANNPPGHRTYLVKDVFKLVLRKCRAFNVLYSTQLLGHSLSSFFADWLHFLLGKFLPD